MPHCGNFFSLLKIPKWNFLPQQVRGLVWSALLPTYYNRIGENLLGQKILPTLSNAIAKLFITKWHGSIRFFVHWRFIHWNGRGFLPLVCRFWSFICVKLNGFIFKFCWGMVLIMWRRIFLLVMTFVTDSLKKYWY